MAQEKFYRRNLPHFVPNDSVYFVTTRLTDSLPVAVVNQLIRNHIELAERGNGDPEVRRQLSKRYLVELDKNLDACKSGPVWLGEPAIREIVKTEILRLHQEEIIDLWCYSIMPNHVHLLFTLRSEELSRAMQFLKGRSSIAANRVLGRRGAFWQHESYDHVVRSNEFERIVRYILLNPVKAGLVENWPDWPGNYLRPDLTML